MSVLAVQSHLSRIGRKLGTGNRAQMVAFAIRAGSIHEPQRGDAIRVDG